MTLFKDLDPEQREAFKSICLQALESKLKEDAIFTLQVYKFLVIGNAAGIALIAAFLSGALTAGFATSTLASPLWKFFLGAVAAAFIQVVHMAVSGDGVTYISKQVMDFFLNQHHIEEFQSWGLSKRGRKIVLGLMLISFLLFLWGSIQSLLLIQQL